MKTITIAALTLAMITAASAQNQNQTTFRDASSRTTGTAIRDSNGTTTWPKRRRSRNRQRTGAP